MFGGMDAGLLGTMDPQLKQLMLFNMLQGASAGLLKAAGPSRMPTGMFGAMGAAAEGANEGMNTGMNMYGRLAQVKKAQAEQKADEAWRDPNNPAFAGLPDTEKALLGSMGGRDGARERYRALNRQEGAPVVKDFIEGGSVVQKQFNPQTRTWDEVGRGSRFAPQQPRQSQLLTPEEEAQRIRMRPSGEDGTGGTPGGFRGTGMDQQAWNVLMKGDTASPAYAAAHAHLTAPKTQLVPNQDGIMTMMTVTPTIPFPAPGARQAQGPSVQAGASPPAVPPAVPGVALAPVPGANGARPSRETRAGDALTEEATLAQQQAASRLFADGKVNRQVIASMWVGGIPGTEGANVTSAMRGAIKNVLYMKTGQAAPDAEVEENYQIYAPKPWDSDDLVREKWQRFEKFVDTYAGRGAARQSAAPPAPVTPPRATAPGLGEVDLKSMTPEQLEEWRAKARKELGLQ